MTLRRILHSSGQRGRVVFFLLSCQQIYCLRPFWWQCIFADFSCVPFTLLRDHRSAIASSSSFHFRRLFNKLNYNMLDRLVRQYKTMVSMMMIGHWCGFAVRWASLLRISVWFADSLRVLYVSSFVCESHCPGMVWEFEGEFFIVRKIKIMWKRIEDNAEWIMMCQKKRCQNKPRPEVWMHAMGICFCVCTDNSHFS